MTNKESIIKYISEMDTKILSFVLDDNRTYQEATKNVFLEKLDEIFEELKQRGETKLTPINGTCGSDECENKGCTGFSFVGLKSNYSINLIFEEENDKVTDIYNCNCMVTESSKNEDVQYISLYVAPDEEANYIPSPDYLCLLQQCQMAIDEISVTEETYLTIEDCKYWINKHKELNTNLKDVSILFNRPNNFKNLYFSLSNIFRHQEKIAEVQKAKIDYATIEWFDELNFVKYLLTFEECILDLISLKLSCFEEVEEPYEGFIEICDKYHIYISVSDYAELLCFYDFISPLYWDMVEKYRIIKIRDKVKPELYKLSDFISFVEIEEFYVF